MKRIKSFAPKRFNQNLLDYLKLQLFLDFLVTVSLIYDHQNRREIISESLSSLKKWVMKIEGIDFYVDNNNYLGVMNKLLVSYDPDIVRSSLLVNRRKLEKSEIEISRQKIERLLSSSTIISPHNVLVESVYQNTEKSNIISVDGIDVSGLSGGSVSNRGMVVGCICEGNNSSLNRKYDSHSPSELRFVHI